VAAGGVGIIVFGVVGALFVGKIANIDGLEAEINQARNPSMYVLCSVRMHCSCV